MPIIKAEQLRDLAEKLLIAVGASRKDATTIASHSIGANLVGHDSHGIIQIPTYIDRVKRGHIIPDASYEIVKDSPTTTVVDGHWGFGYVVTEMAMRTTIEKARSQNIAAATVFRQSHIGRLADYPLMASEANMIGLITADSGRSAKSVVPFGGRDKRLGTNPISIAMPSNLDGPYYLDMASSAVAAGKIEVAKARGKDIPEGWIIDDEGNPSTDPTDLSSGGSILPLGGPEGHKGYGLSSIVEILSGVLTGLGYGHDPSGRHNDGCFMAVFNVAAFRDLADFKKDVTDFAMYLKSSRPATGFKEVYYPGELEHLRSVHHEANGIDVDQSTWDQLTQLAREYGIDDALLKMGN